MVGMQKIAWYALKHYVKAEKTITFIHVLKMEKTEVYDMNMMIIIS